MSDDVIKAIIGIVPSVLTLILVFLQGRKLGDIHTLTNSNMGIALKLNAANSKWRAEASGKPEDLQASDQAQALLDDHEQKQAAVDAKT